VTAEIVLAANARYDAHAPVASLQAGILSPSPSPTLMLLILGLLVLVPFRLKRATAWSSSLDVDQNARACPELACAGNFLI